MRSVFFALLLLLAVLIGLFAFSGYLGDKSEGLLSVVDALITATRDESWEEVDEGLSRLSENWETLSPRLALFSDHSLLDEIMLEVSSAKGYAAYREAPELLADLETLRSLIAHLPKREALSLYNIF